MILPKFFSRSKHNHKKRKLKTHTIVAIVIIVILLPIALFLAWKATNSKAAWYSASWNYRQSLTITNNSSQATYAVAVPVDTATLIGAAKLQSDCDDLVFTQSDGTTLLDYYIEYCSGSSSTGNSIVWVEYPSLPAGNSTVYMYYGNTGATASSNATNTFGASTEPTGIDIGSGADGSVSISADQNINTADLGSATRSCADGGDAVNYVFSSVSTTTITLGSTPSSGCLNEGDEILIIQLTGSNAGRFEFRRLTADSSGTDITIDRVLTNTYASDTMVQRVPNYTSVTTSTAGTDLTANGFNGTRGGVVMFRANGSVSIAASTTVNAHFLGGNGGAGGAGGVRGVGNASGGIAGGNGSNGVSGAGNGGGTMGTAQTTGGAGGPAGTGNQAAGGAGGGAGGGGGGGTYGVAGTNGSIGVNGGNGGNGGATGLIAAKGIGGAQGVTGATYGNANFTTSSSNLFLGSGGGGGAGGGGGGGADRNTSGTGGNGGVGGNGGAGGNGGGIVAIFGNVITNSGNIGANGQNGTIGGTGNGGNVSGGNLSGGGGGAGGGGGGGGGSGGSIWLSGQNVVMGTTTIISNGGTPGRGGNGGLGRNCGTGTVDGGGGGGGGYNSGSGANGSCSTGGAGQAGNSGVNSGNGGRGGQGRVFAQYSVASGSTAPAASTSTLPFAGAPSGEEDYASTLQRYETYWAMSEGYGTTVNDTNSGNNDGTITNAVWRSEEYCVADNCLYFDGSGDYVSDTDDPDLDLGTDESATFSLWFRHPDISTNPDYLIAKHDGTEAGYKIYMNADGTITCGLDSDSTWSPTDSTSSTQSYDDNRWHHLACVKSTTTSLRLYIDGQPVGTEDTSIAASVANNDTLYLGIDGNGSSNGWQGFIDEFKMRRTALSADDVKAEFNSRGTGRGTSAQFGGNNKWLSDGLVGYWKLDESSGNTCTGGTNDNCDSSGNGFDGAWSGNATTSTNAKYRRSVTFDGTNDFVSVADNDAFSANTTNQLTVSAWIYPSSLSGNRHYVNKGVGSNYEWSILTIGSDLTAVVWDSSGVNIAQADFVGGATLSTWQHVTFTLDLSSRKLNLYKNGGLVDSETWNTGTYTNGSALLKFGEDGDNTGDVNGLIDDVRVYNRLFTDSEVKALSEWGPGPTGWWKLDENSSSTAADSSTNGNTATLNAMEAADVVPGKYGSALEFDGSNEQGYVNNTNFEVGSGSFTLSAWVWRDTDTTEDGIAGYRDSGLGNTCSSSANAGYNMMIYSTDEVSIALCDGTNGVEFYTAQNLVPLDTWTHVAAVIDRNDSNNRRIYINGSSVSVTQLGTMPTGNLTPPVSTIFSYGAYGTDSVAPSDPFDGRLDDVKMYHYARSAKQIVEDMNAGHPAVGSPVASPIGYWKMDEGIGETVNNSGSSGSNLNGNFAGATACPGNSACPSWTNAGKYNKGISFDGGDHVDAGTNSALNFERTQPFTLSTWFKTSNDGSQTLIGKMDNNTSDRGYEIQTGGSGFLYFQVINTYSSNGIEISSDVDYADGNWHHVVATYDGSSSASGSKLYYDGKLLNTNTNFNNLSATIQNSVSFKLGSRTGASPQYFNGTLDEAKVYNYDLTPDEVLLEYNRGKSIALGAPSTASDGETVDYSGTREYCVPGDTSTCSAPVGEWKFDEGTGTTANDTSGNTNTGTLNGNATWGNGKQGRSLLLDGAGDYAGVGNDSSLSISGAITIEAWIKPTSASLSSYHQIMGNAAATGCESQYSMYLLDADLIFSISDSLCVYEDYTLDSNLSANTWYHLVVTNDGSDNVTIYINGIPYSPVKTNSVTTPSSSVSSTSWGRNGSYDSEYFAGQIDTARIYNYVRTPSQIAWSFNKGGPIGWWKLDETSGTTAYDASGNGNNGTLTNSPTRTTSGKLNSAIDFDGSDDYVTITDDPELDVVDTRDFTIEAWVRRDTSTTDDTIVAKKNGQLASDAGYVLFIDDSADTVNLYVSDGTDQYTAYCADTITDTSWHHIVASFSNSNGGSVLIDGKCRTSLESGTLANVNSLANALAFRIGAESDNGEPFDGAIDNVRMYGYVPTQEQVETMINSGAVRFAPVTGTP